MDYDDDDADNVGDDDADADNVGDDVDSHDGDAGEDDWMLLHTNVDPSIRCQVGWVTVCIILVMIDVTQLIKMMNGRCRKIIPVSGFGSSMKLLIFIKVSILI